MPGSLTRQKIIQTATEVIYKKGYHGASVAEIASCVGISPSVVYKHFKNKDDLLFSIPLENSIQFFKILENDLQGIEGNENLLRKLTWSLLNFYEVNPKYASILLMECRSNRAFYKSQAYGFVRRISKMFLTIFEAGKQNGDFNRDNNSILIRDLMFGSIDYSVLSCLVLKEIPNITDDAKGLFQLFKNMTKLPSQKNTERDNKGNRLLDAAIEIFKLKGYHEATISEIAAKAQVSNGILYQYFKNKEDLLFSMAERKLSKDITSLNEMFHIRTPLRKLRRFIKFHCLLYLNDRSYLDIFLTLIQTNRNFYQMPAYNPLRQYSEFLMNIIKEGQKEDIFIPGINPRIFRNMFLGGLNHVFLRWLIVDKLDETDKLNQIEEVTNLLAASVSK